MKKRSSISTSALLLVFASAVSGSAFASPAIPARVKSHLDLECTPKCTACHDSAMAGRSNAKRPFALSVLDVLGDERLDITSPDSIEIALDQLKNDGIDSDGDEVSDIAELTASPPSDPSVAGALGQGQLCIDPEAEYGCGARYASVPSSRGALAPLVGSILGIFALRAWRRRQRVS